MDGSSFTKPDTKDRTLRPTFWAEINAAVKKHDQEFAAEHEAWSKRMEKFLKERFK